MIERMSQTAPETAGFSQDLFSCRLTEGQDQFLMLKGCEEGHVSLVIDDDHAQRRA